jgi:DNA primase small subunit
MLTMSSVTPLNTQMYRWLSYGNDPHGTSPLTDKTYFVRREMSFTIANDIYIRYQCFKDKEDMIQQIQKMKVSLV